MTTNKQQYLITVWHQLLEYLHSNRNIATTVIDNFYVPCSLYDLSDEKAIIEAPNIISKEVIQADLEMLSASFTDLLQLSHPIIVEIYQKSELPTDLSSNDFSDFKSSDFESMPIQQDRTFDNFVVGDCNRESRAAALACALYPGKFNPLFIYGNSGLGKTHLLMAIANYVMKNDPTKKVYYTESIKFVENVVNSIRDGKIDAFKKYMYSVDLLLVDDIQFLAGKEKSHEIFFTIYNELINNKKQICIASDRQPKEIKGLEDRLISRFSSGLSLGIDSPEFETSLAILQMKIKQNGYGIEDVDKEGLEYIASNFSGNVRDLEGAWNRVLFYSIEFQKGDEKISFETVLNALKNQAVVSDKTGLSPKKIIKVVADYYGLTHQQITSKTRTKNIANARHISIYLCRKLLDIPYIKIGDEFGGRDHSTIISACTKVEKQIKKDPNFANVIKEIEKELTA
ncbi:MAG: chromosomal replication initiator protein DnaA [Solobacterium sp.]|jgi:chromosomal replication initiator protein|nr:chromosomal replication initiator protein DnaA [Solobacterium sp.]MCH4226603.1 chromosomal replication initiator protein DnaA [Solobacterium sp.]MCH4283462.1 chromosomal replication initiator protein DnaA [Solobacterium sp.]